MSRVEIASPGNFKKDRMLSKGIAAQSVDCAFASMAFTIILQLRIVNFSTSDYFALALWKNGLCLVVGRKKRAILFIMRVSCTAVCGIVNKGDSYQ
ncbi:MAG: hypothetical protein IJJ33_11240 [Victivallales bacterium]|nr:hypothetical protein [Victivallales bacterium]